MHFPGLEIFSHRMLRHITLFLTFPVNVLFLNFQVVSLDNILPCYSKNISYDQRSMCRVGSFADLTLVCEAFLQGKLEQL